MQFLVADPLEQPGCAPARQSCLYSFLALLIHAAKSERRQERKEKRAGASAVALQDMPIQVAGLYFGFGNSHVKFEICEVAHFIRWERCGAELGWKNVMAAIGWDFY